MYFIKLYLWIINDKNQTTSGCNFDAIQNIRDEIDLPIPKRLMIIKIIDALTVVLSQLFYYIIRYF